MSIFSQYKGLNRNLYIMATTVLINCAGGFVPVFLSLYLIVILHLDAATTGLLVSVYGFVYIPGLLIGGKIADKFGRKKLMVISQIVMGLSFIVAGFFIHSYLAILFILLANFADGITDPARNAMEGDLTTPQTRQASFSFIYQCLNIGVAIGPVMASLLFNSYPNWLFWGNGIALLISIIIVMIFIPESIPTKEEHKKYIGGEALVEGKTIDALKARPQLFLFAIALFFIALSYKEISFALPLQLQALLKDKGTELYGFLASFNAILVIVFNPFILKLNRKTTPIKNLLIASVLYMVSFSLFGLASKTWQFYLITLAYTIGEMTLNNNSSAYQYDNTPVNFRGRFNSIMPLFKMSGKTLAPILGGLLLSFVSFKLFWLIVGVITLCAVLIYSYIIARFEREK